MSPTQRTLKALREDGYTAWVVERWNPYAKVRQDMAGCIDVLSWKAKMGILGVQATSASNVSSRVNKIAPLQAAKEWILAGGRLEVWGWRKGGKRGKPKRWEKRVVRLAVRGGQIVEAG